jgi:hypothetical protein
MKVAQVGSSSVIAVEGPGGSVLFYWQPIGSQQWNQQIVMQPGKGNTVSAPSVAQVGNSSVIAVQLPDAPPGLPGSNQYSGPNMLLFFWQPIGSQQWNQEFVAGYDSAFSAPSVAQVGDSTVIAVQGPRNSLQVYWQPIGSQQWNQETVAGPGSAFSAPSVAQVGNSSVIAVEGPDGSVLFYWQPIGSLQWTREAVAPAGTDTE